MKNPKAMLIPASPDERVRLITLDGNFRTIQKLVGGTFDVCRGENIVGYVHDEGLIIGLEYNELATLFFERLVVGDVVIVGCLNPQGYYDGENYDVPDEYLTFLESTD